MLRYEAIMWLSKILFSIPGKTGCLLRNILIPYKNGKKVYIWDSTHIDSPSKFIIGNNVSINRRCIINAGGGIEIKDNVLIGPNTTIYSQNHNFKDPDSLICDQGYTLAPVTIGENVWIASNCIILPGVTVGKNSIIGAGSVVTKSIPENSLAVGNPARVIKKNHA